MGISKKTVSAILKFVSMLFLTFTKEDQQKNCARYFKIRKYPFLIFEKGIHKKTVPSVFRFVSMFSLIFKKRDQQIYFVTYFRIRRNAFLIFQRE